MTGYAQVERRELADLLELLGPDRPTLCEGWSTRDMAAHLVVRERRPDAALGLVVPPLRHRAERVHRETAARPYPELVRLVRAAPWWSLVSNPAVDSAANTMEFFIHHEDVRRAQPQWQPRTLPERQEAGLWARAGGLGRFALRRFPATVLLVAPGFGERAVGAGAGRARGATGGDTSGGGTGATGTPANAARLRLTGKPSELVLFLFGRQRAAQVDLDGPPDLAERLRAAPLGI